MERIPVGTALDASVLEQGRPRPGDDERLRRVRRRRRLVGPLCGLLTASLIGINGLVSMGPIETTDTIPAAEWSTGEAPALRDAAD